MTKMVGTLVKKEVTSNDMSNDFEIISYLLWNYGNHKNLWDGVFIPNILEIGSDTNFDK